MDVVKVLEIGAINELTKLDIKELVETVIGKRDYYTLPSRIDSFNSKVNEQFNYYWNKMNEIDNFEKELNYKIDNQKYQPNFEEEPSYKRGILGFEVRDNLIDLLEEYFDKNVFLSNKTKWEKENNITRVVQEDNYSLDLELNISSRQIYAFLSSVGYYQRNYHYFLTASDVFNICYKYSGDVCKINGFPYHYFNIFGKWGRIEEYAQTEGIQDYLDIDNISLRELVVPYLKTNTNELKQIYNNIVNGFRYGRYWNEIMEENEEYIKDCEQKGLMIKL